MPVAVELEGVGVRPMPVEQAPKYAPCHESGPILSRLAKDRNLLQLLVEIGRLMTFEAALANSQR
jgi:hypothetical protein